MYAAKIDSTEGHCVALATATLIGAGSVISYYLIDEVCLNKEKPSFKGFSSWCRKHKWKLFGTFIGVTGSVFLFHERKNIKDIWNAYFSGKEKTKEIKQSAVDGEASSLPTSVTVFEERDGIKIIDEPVEQQQSKRYQDECGCAPAYCAYHAILNACMDDHLSHIADEQVRTQERVKLFQTKKTVIENLKKQALNIPGADTGEWLPPDVVFALCQDDNGKTEIAHWLGTNKENLPNIGVFAPGVECPQQRSYAAVVYVPVNERGDVGHYVSMNCHENGNERTFVVRNSNTEFCDFQKLGFLALQKAADQMLVRKHFLPS